MASKKKDGPKKEMRPGRKPPPRAAPEPPVTPEEPAYESPLPCKVGTSHPALMIDFEAAAEASGGEFPEFEPLAREVLAELCGKKSMADISLWGEDRTGISPASRQLTSLFWVFVLGKAGTGVAKVLADTVKARWGRRACTLGAGTTSGMECAILGIKSGVVVSHTP